MGALLARAAGDADRTLAPASRFCWQMSSARALLREFVAGSWPLPLLSYFGGGGFANAVRDAVGGGRVEDCWLNFFCVSTDLTNVRPACHKAGELAKYVTASMSLTTLLPPVYDHADGGRLLVDGAYCDNLPVSIMRDEYGARVVIGVDVENKDHSAFDDIAPWDYLAGYPG